MRSGFTFAALLILLPSCARRQDSPPPSEAPPTVVRVVAVGDILMHRQVQESARRAGGFGELWKEILPLAQPGDILFGNLETPVAPRSGRPGVPYVFNAPADLPDALKRSGFTVLSTANNHMYDQGRLGVLETLERLEENALIPLGSGRELPAAPVMLERQGLRFAFLAWTDLFNRNDNRPGRGPWVQGFEAGAAQEAVRAVRRQADVVVVSLHWGREDRHQPTVRQEQIASDLVAAGADLILGHHPHVLQPMVFLERAGRRGAVIYSLGNFISNQDRFYDPRRMPVERGDCRDGVALVASFRKTPGGGACLEHVRAEPLWTLNQSDGSRGREIRVIRVAASHPRYARICQTLGGRLELP